VLGAEVNQAMCDAGVHTLVMNSYGAKCIMVNKDVRHLEASAKPDGTPPDMHSKADIAIFEVLQQKQDSACLCGQSASHLYQKRKKKRKEKLRFSAIITGAS